MNSIGQVRVKITNTSRNKTIFDDSAYSFKKLTEQYDDKLKELFLVPELKQFIEENGYKKIDLEIKG